ncbi:hypothetical protein ACYOEI_05550 [Singulisphaera rosea]
MYRSFLQVSVVVAALFAGSAWGFQKGAETRSSYKDTVHGFMIDLPNFPGAGPKTPGMVFTAAGPVQDKFAPNVNVVIQATSTKVKDFVDLSIGQFKQLGMKLHSQTLLKVAGHEAVILDYQGSINGGRELRFLSLSVIEKERVVLVTCTTTPDAFAQGEAEFRACLDSLKFD